MSELILHSGTPTKDDPNYYSRWEEIGQVTTNYNSQPTIVYGDWKTYWNLINWLSVKLVVLPSTGTEYYEPRDINRANPLPVISLKNAEILADIRGVSEWCLFRILAFAEQKKLNISGSKVLLIGGDGRIGTHMLEVLKAMKATVYSYDVGKAVMPIEHAICIADIISIHIPLEGNVNFYNEQLLNLTKGKILINSSRKDIVHEKVEELAKNGLIHYAHDFGRYERVGHFLSSPHIAGSKTHDRILTDEWLVKEVKNYLLRQTKTPIEKQ